MPELPDITIYMEALERHILGRTLHEVRLKSPFLLRSIDPPLAAVRGQPVQRLRRIGKRIAIGLEGDLWLVLHLMINGRLHWKQPGTALAGRYDLAAFDFPSGTLTLTEFGPKKRAALHLVRGGDALLAHDPGGLEVQDASPEAFREALIRENHTLKRALTDPRLFSGIGNAYSDEILHRARLSPLAMTQKLAPDEIARLHDATRATLADWIARLRAEYGDAFPEKVSAFRKGMAVHGRYREPCPDCGTAVQRIRFADNETNYCPRCQTGGQLLADRALSRLLRSDWPRTIEELEQGRAPAGGPAAPASRGRSPIRSKKTMSADDGVRIEPLTPERWSDLERLFGPNGACAGCWCMWWRLPRRAFEAGAGDGNRAAFKAIVEAGPPPGLIAYVEEKPVAWCQATPRAALPTLDRSRLLKPVDDRPVWSISCFFVKTGHRRGGLTARLIEAAKDHARAAGAEILEAYPWETAEKRASSTIYTGRASTFLRLGFSEVARRAPHRPVLRYELGR